MTPRGHMGSPAGQYPRPNYPRPNTAATSFLLSRFTGKHDGHTCTLNLAILYVNRSMVSDASYVFCFCGLCRLFNVPWGFRKLLNWVKKR